ncbi:WecB/TagA/CpsF family glycosyltransferase [Demequina sp. SYSU T00039]|uniref:WecB/TagA/CpsF family glycosyltransferase n=1 Tax=Demequina lignilytica TaxID=3051663 RepID=A0AAW7M5K3_9MICO|nr:MULTISPECIES: WecB/TagA/CpsF family glycosyltransferase [unclassified Demequina]MDN4477427.1 WecB/TagA/CpsF family glycosyltransferase [Demequina sp. SYSU T00039-1]MDN4488222.1 WecB/TagA/CpsF family glycosyltransferase [Demequina sp. SYSU T00039]
MTVAPSMTIGGVAIAPASLDEAVDDALLHAEAHDGTCLRFTNTWCIVLADRDPEYKALLNGSGENFADGRPVADAVQRRRGGRDSHVRGPSFFEEVLDRGRVAGVRHFFYGADDETLAKLATVVAERYPGAIIAGRLAPPFGTADELCAPELLARIDVASPDIVWVGLGTPKQDIVATCVAKKLGVTTAAVGAAFDFVAGTKAVAPLWMRRTKLEWLFRFASEPKRLWQRYTTGIIDWERIMWRERRRHA